MRSIDTLVIGGGQAGLATSHHLTAAGREHVVLDAGRVGETWRRARWDSFALVTPNWTINLPGLAEQPQAPGGFMGRDDVVGLLERYAADVRAPVREGIRVETLEADGTADSGFMAHTTDGPIRARRVVVATGWFRRPRRPDWASGIDAAVLQLDATGYRNPGDLPPGGVLVVGSGQSGVQVVEDLQLAGREVWLSVGRAGRIPRRYRGRDVFEWAVELGLMQLTEDKSLDPRGRFGPNPHISGARGGRTINLHRFARDGVHLLGRVSGADGSRLRVDGDLHERLAGADRAAAEIKGGIDKLVAETGLDAPAPDPSNSDDHDGLEGFEVEAVRELDLAAAGISSIIWAAGQLPDWSWIRLPVFGLSGEPVHDGGIARVPGLGFVGIRFQRWLKSDLLYGVGEDAAYVVERLEAQG